MKTSPAGIALIQAFEDCSLTAYPDPKTGGAPWTIFWGHTGPEVVEGMTGTQEQADAQLLVDLEQFERDVMGLVSGPMTQGQFDALVSFAYNCGSDIDADTKAEGLGDSTLLKKFNARDLDGTEREWMKWVSPGSSVEKGLRRRRAAELELFRS